MTSCCNVNSKDHQLWIGLVALTFGGVVLLQKLGWLPENTFEYLWPSVLLVTGFKWIVSSRCECGKVLPTAKKKNLQKKALPK